MLICPCCSRINRNILECKGPTHKAHARRFICINRNILECKDGFRSPFAAALGVLIETYWNVKIHGTRKRTIEKAVLIETYWNVKLLLNIAALWYGLQVLIETYWNVKEGSATKLDGYHVCINRNILECKVRNARYQIQLRLVLIETYWNVKFCKDNGI